MPTQLNEPHIMRSIYVDIYGSLALDLVSKNRKGEQNSKFGGPQPIEHNSDFNPGQPSCWSSSLATIHHKTNQSWSNITSYHEHFALWGGMPTIIKIMLPSKHSQQRHNWRHTWPSTMYEIIIIWSVWESGNLRGNFVVSMSYASTTGSYKTTV